MLFTAVSIVPVGVSGEVPHTMTTAVDKTMRWISSHHCVFPVVDVTRYHRRLSLRSPTSTGSESWCMPAQAATQKGTYALAIPRCLRPPRQST